MDTQTPSLARKRRWWWRWFLKPLLGLVLFVVLAWVILCGCLRYFGQRAWSAYEAEARAQGKKLYLPEMAPPPVPVDENYAMAPVYRDYIEKKLADSNYGQRLLRLPFLPNPMKPDHTSQLARWQALFVKEKWIPAATNNPAAGVLAALERFEPILIQIRAASARPKCHWPVDWSQGVKAKFFHWQILEDVAKVFALRAEALIDLGQTDEALAELRHAMRAFHSLDREPSMLSAWVQKNILRVVLDAAETGIEHNRWSAEQLASLVKEVEGLNLLANWQSALEGGRGASNSLIEGLYNADKQTLEGLTVFWPGVEDSGGWKLALFLTPRGWIRMSQVEYNRVIDLEHQGIDEVRERIAPEFSHAQQRADARRAGFDRYYHSLSDVLIRVHGGVAWAACDAHTRLQHFRILCALSAYRMKHGELPATLDPLVPEFIAAVPHDIMDGMPMRYRREADGGCTLWSIGRNRVDDGGAVDPKKPRKWTDADWVTRLPGRAK